MTTSGMFSPRPFLRPRGRRSPSSCGSSSRSWSSLIVSISVLSPDSGDPAEPGPPGLWARAGMDGGAAEHESLVAHVAQAHLAHEGGKGRCIVEARHRT